MRYDAVLTQTIDEQMCKHLLRHLRGGRRQEELCFALWRPSTGATRTSAVVFEGVLPTAGERDLHGNASFEASYLARAVRCACSQQAGLAFLHSHPASGWQGMSKLDEVAERDRIAPPARATGYPLVGLTLGADGAWSARFWTWNGTRFVRSWCEKVRVAGRVLRVTWNDRLIPPPQRQPTLRRTIDTWGEARQSDLARLRVGVVGLGSVGCMVAEALARVGVQRLVLIDPDVVETHNLDRLLYAGRKDVGRHKVELAARHLRTSATAAGFEVQAYGAPIEQERTFLAALDCDVLMSAVDRPLPKDLLNRIAYAHCIPVISGGVFIDTKRNGSLGQAAWSVTAVGPERRCLRCDGQYTSSDVVMERDGSLDDPAYVRRAAAAGGLPANQNVFPFSANLASFMAIELARLVVAEDWWPDTGGKLHYSMIPSRLRTERAACAEHCTVRVATATGDRFRYPFLLADAASARRSVWKRLCHWIRRRSGRARR